MIGNMFKIPRHKMFNYKPIYYSEAKEDLQSRIDDVKRELGVEVDSKYTSNIKGQIRRNLHRDSFSKQDNSFRRSIIIIVNIILLALIFYMVVDFFPELVK